MLVVAGASVGADAVSAGEVAGAVAGAGALFGLLVGLPQGMALRSLNVPADGWVLGSIAAWMVAMLATVGVLSLLPTGAGWMELAFLGAVAAILAGAALGTIGGAALVLAVRGRDRRTRAGGSTMAPA
jgi:hypothetical protein